MEYVNSLNQARRGVRRRSCDDARLLARSMTLLVLLAPMAPHVAEELWHERGHSEQHSSRSPGRSIDPALTVGRDGDAGGAGERQGARQAGGRAGPVGGEARELALASPKVQSALEGRER